MNTNVKTGWICFFLPAMVSLAMKFSLLQADAQTPPDATPAPAADQPATPVTAPPNIPPNSPLAQVARLTQAGVDPSVILTYITNSTSAFNLDSDRIIYLSNLGAPSSLITAMMERDRQVQQQLASQAANLPPLQTGGTSASSADSTAGDATQTSVPPVPVTVDYFYDALAPYGSWVVVNGYGRCWRPTVCIYNSGWQPYCDHGQWVYSDCGWYWNSDYAWGATFHYGRWFRNPTFGWCWYPDTLWAPSWVTWRYSNNYCGWAPLPPHTTYQAGVGMVYNGRSVSVGFDFGLNANCFTFVTAQHFCDPHPRNYRVAPTQVTQIYNQTTVINNFNVNNRLLVNHGIALENIAAVNRAPIHPVPVREINHRYANGAGRPFFDRSRHDGVPAQNYFSSPNPHGTAPPAAPPLNHYQQPNHSISTAAIPPGATPASAAAGYRSAHAVAPAYWQQTGTPRMVTSTHPTGWQNAPDNHLTPAASHEPSASSPHQNYHATSPPAAPAYSAAPAPGAPGGNHGANQSWPGH